MARAIAEGLARVDPAGAASYQAGLERYTALLDAKIAEWEKLAAPLRGVKAVSYHQDLVYLADRFGLELVGTIETKPGVPATPGHLEQLVETMKREQVKLVIREVAYELPLARDAGGAHRRAGRHHLHAGGRAAGHADVRRLDRRQPRGAAASGAAEEPAR